MKKDEIVQLLKEGKSVNYISKKLKCSKGTVSYHRKSLGIKYNNKIYNDFNWKEIQNYYDKTKCSYDVLYNKFGLTRAHIRTAISKNIFSPREYRKSLDYFLVENFTYKASNKIKKLLLKEGIFKNCCSICGQKGSWNNKPLILQLDHINGINSDNRLENLRLLCPNCHSQTHTYAGKNVGNKPVRSGSKTDSKPV